MEAHSIPKYTLNFPLSPNEADIGKFNLLSETESDRRNHGDVSDQINELRAQLEIVNEDRQRLKKVIEKLKYEKTTDLTRFIASHTEIQKQQDNDRVTALQQELNKIRKECEEKDKLLNSMRKLLGGKYDLLAYMDENQENKVGKIAASPIKSSGQYNSRLPGTRGTLKANRSISPYTKCA